MKTRTKTKKSHTSSKRLSDKLSAPAKRLLHITQADLDSQRTEIPGYRDLNKEKQNKSGLGVEISKSGAILLLIGLMLLSSISLITVHNTDVVKAYYAPLLI